MVKGITHILTNDNTVRSLVGRNASDSKYKAYPVVCPQPEKVPYSVVRQTARIPVECKQSAPTEYNYQYEVISFTDSYDDSEALDNAVIAALSKPAGGTHNGVVFQDIRHVTTRDEVVKTEGGTILYGKVSVFEAMVTV